MMSLDADIIVDYLYVGGRGATQNPEMLHEIGITHVVTISDHPVEKIVNSGLFKYKFIQGLDMEDSDLLKHFSATTAFIEDGVNSGGVLVHCMAGVSRSVTMVMAYLMEKKGMCFDEALALVQKKRKYANPNDGFVKQLKLYEKMNCQLDLNNKEFRQIRIQSLVLTMQILGPKDGNMIFLPGDLQENPKVNEGDVIFKCKKCRQPLFKRSGLMKHSVGMGEIAFDWRGAESCGTNMEKSTELCEKSLFIEPVEWMKEFILETAGKIVCPKCSGKLGSYVWHGERCPCGQWVAPAFHIQTSKVDECRPIGAGLRNLTEPEYDT